MNILVWVYNNQDKISIYSLLLHYFSTDRIHKNTNHFIFCWEVLNITDIEIETIIPILEVNGISANKN